VKDLLERRQRDARWLRPLLRYGAEYERLALTPDANTYRLEKSLGAIRRLAQGFSDSEDRRQILDWCEEQERRIQGLKDDFRFRFGDGLRAALAERGYALSGQFPTLRVGLYTVKLDFDAGTAAIFWGPEVEGIRTRIPLASALIAAAVAEFDQRLQGGEFSAETYLALLLRAYLRARPVGPAAEAARVRLTAVLPEVALLLQPKKFGVNPVRANFRDYSRVQFGFDLFRLRRRDALIAGGQRLQLTVATFDSTTEKARALWVPDNEQGEGTYFSYLSFVAEPA
jgi:hypothetical protein